MTWALPPRTARASRSKSMASPITVPAGHLHHARRGAGRSRRARSSAPPTRSSTSVPAACAWSRSRAARDSRPRAPPKSPPGMKVRTQSEALTKMRRGVLELYVSEHPMGSCPDASRCELETLAAGTWHRASRASRAADRASRAHAAARRCQQSVFPFRQRPVHRLLALRARLR